MNTMFLRLCLKLENLVNQEDGQDLVEYVLVVALITLGAVTSMKGMAHAVSTELSVVEATFATSV
jgi:pilus assembly protein Flp/PilA